MVAAMAAAVAGAGAAAALWQALRRSLPVTEGTVTVPSGPHGPEHPVEIRRDRWGVPHIHAETDDDLWFGQGFAFGQDRLWQLELHRRIARGRLSEFAGPSTLPADRLMRTLGIARIAEAEARAADSITRRGLEAYSAGINAAARTGPGRLPPEFQVLRLKFEPWTPADCLAVAKVLHFGLSTNWERELLRADLAATIGPEKAAKIDPTYPKGHPVVTSPGKGWSGRGRAMASRIAELRTALGFTTEATGSNNWAVNGERTVGGGALLAGDPHLPVGIPGLVYQVGLYRGDRFLRGGALPGMPGIAFGQNNDVAWSMTNTMADLMDLFVERVRGEVYDFEGKPRPLSRRTEVIIVKGQRPVSVEVRETHHGPIVNDCIGGEDAPPLALAWTGSNFPGITAANFGLLDVTGGDGLVSLLADNHAPASCVVWADRDGRIGFKSVGRIPMRAKGSPDLPRPGWDGKHEWTGWIPYEEQPQLDNPDTGYVLTANNRVVDGRYRHHITSEWLDGWRATRIEQLITGREKIDLADFEAMQMDLLSIPGLETAKRLARLKARDERQFGAIERLRVWDGRMERGSVAAAIYQALTLHLGRGFALRATGDADLAARWLGRSANGFSSHMTALWRWHSHLLALWEEADAELIGGDWDELVLDALDEALDHLENEYGDDPDDWQWGRIHKVEFEHPLAAANPVLAKVVNRSASVGGAPETVNQVGWNPADPFNATWVPSWRMVADPARPDRSRWQIPTGQSGHPGSPHYDDLLPRWSEGRMQSMAGEAPWRTLTLQPAR